MRLPKQSALVYALGTIGIDYGSEERRRVFEHILASSLYDTQKLVEYLKQEEVTPDVLIWTLNQNSLPIYVILPDGAFARHTFDRLMEILQGQLDQGVELVSVPGTIEGKTKLLSGTEVPVIVPDLAGIVSWSTDEMMLKVLGPPPREPGREQTIYDQKMAMVNHFLDTVFYQMQNKGNTPKDRALNFAATNAFRIKEAFEKAYGDRLVLQSIDVKRKPFSPPDSDYWEVKLIYFNQSVEVRTRQASKVFSFTIDISSVIPATVGKMSERYS
ncbi:peptidase [bacterium]|nr:peptidase [bacterium]